MVKNNRFFGTFLSECHSNYKDYIGGKGLEQNRFEDSR